MWMSKILCVHPLTMAASSTERKEKIQENYSIPPLTHPQTLPPNATMRKTRIHTTVRATGGRENVKSWNGSVAFHSGKPFILVIPSDSCRYWRLWRNQDKHYVWSSVMEISYPLWQLYLLAHKKKKTFWYIFHN